MACMNSALFDTNLVIDALNGIEMADAEYHRYEQVYISLITWMEVMIGTDEDGYPDSKFSTGLLHDIAHHATNRGTGGHDSQTTAHQTA